MSLIYHFAVYTYHTTNFTQNANTNNKNNDRCYPDTPCNQSQDNINNAAVSAPLSETAKTYYCGYDWNWVVSNCNK